MLRRWRRTPSLLKTRPSSLRRKRQRKKSPLLLRPRRSRPATQSLLPSVDFASAEAAPASTEAAPATPAEPEMVEVWRPGRPQGERRPRDAERRGGRRRHTSGLPRRPKDSPQAKQPRLPPMAKPSLQTQRRRPMASARSVTAARVTAAAIADRARMPTAKSPKGRPSKPNPTKANPAKSSGRIGRHGRRAPSVVRSVAIGRRAKIGAIVARGAIVIAATTIGKRDPGVPISRRAATRSPIRTRRSPSCWP